MKIKNLKLFLALGLVGFLLSGALLIWGAVSAVQFVVSSVSAPVVKEQAAQLQVGLEQLSGVNFAPVECWNRAQSLLSVTAWLGAPVLANLESLKTSCLQAEEGKAI